jgi:protein-disulfide isomerase
MPNTNATYVDLPFKSWFFLPSLPPLAPEFTMRYLPIFLAAIILASGFVLARAEDKPVPVVASAAKFSDADKAAIEEIVKNYLVNEHPEIIMEAAQKIQQRDMATATTKSEAEIAKLKEKILNDPNTPSSGDPKGDVTIVEFYDYQCGYCKMAEAASEKILKEDQKVRFVYRTIQSWARHPWKPPKLHLPLCDRTNS